MTFKFIHVPKIFYENDSLSEVSKSQLCIPCAFETEYH